MAYHARFQKSQMHAYIATPDPKLATVQSVLYQAGCKRLSCGSIRRAELGKRLHELFHGARN